MNLHAFYNKQYIGDVLLIRLSHKRTVTNTQLIDDVCVLYNNDEVIGYNLFDASHYISDLKEGQVKITQKFVDELNKELSKLSLMQVESDCDDKFVVGKVEGIEIHPDSDHLHICQVNVKDEVLQIVCGAPNVALNQYVVVAKKDAVMPTGLIIRPSKLRGIDSCGMLCSARELALPNAPDVRGILVLDEDKYEIGESFFK
ncbi:MAG: DUF4479 domain-containing protein [Coprobacillus sp.]